MLSVGELENHWGSFICDVNISQQLSRGMNLLNKVKLVKMNCGTNNSAFEYNISKCFKTRTNKRNMLCQHVGHNVWSFEHPEANISQHYPNSVGWCYANMFCSFAWGLSITSPVPMAVITVLVQTINMLSGSFAVADPRMHSAYIGATESSKLQMNRFAWIKAVIAYLWQNVSLIFLRCMTLCCPEVWSCLYHACETLKGHSFFMGRGGGGGFWGGIQKFSS